MIEHVSIDYDVCLWSKKCIMFFFQILKDITNRYKLLKGYQIHYIPGWDCHGMPIEQKALAKIRADHTKLEPMKIRKTGI